MKHNYLLMDESHLKNGRYIPDYDVLKAQARNDAELEYINAVEERHREYLEDGYVSFAGFTYPFVYFRKMVCGHYEILQNASIKSEEEAVRYLDWLAEQKPDRECTHCLCEKQKGI